MAGGEQGGLAIRRDGIDQRLAASSHLQLVAERRCEHSVGRGHLMCEQTGKAAVVNTAHRAQRLAIEPLIAHDTVIIGSGARAQCSNGRGTVDGCKGIGGIDKDPAAIHQAFQAAFAVERGKGFKIVGAQLVDGDAYNQSRHRACRILGCCVGGKAKKRQQCDIEVFICHVGDVSSILTANLVPQAPCLRHSPARCLRRRRR